MAVMADEPAVSLMLSSPEFTRRRAGDLQSLLQARSL